jgi:23S rRNA (adenine2503-C2)-methyltransferase
MFARPMDLDLRSLTPAELAAHLPAGGTPAYRGEQVFRWLHEQAVERVDEMTNVPRPLREALVASVPLRPLHTDVVQEARDGTRKLRFRTTDDRAIESVLIPDDKDERDKLTLCVSSQVGCAMDCGFCATATLGFGRNLTAGEIVEQVYRATKLAGRRPTNLVFMGMGEPMHNFDNVARALGLLQHPWGLHFSPRRITVSTVGMVPGIEKLGQLSPAPNLAISLNATTDEVRDRIMPVNRKWPIAKLLDAARKFPLAHGRRITFEYVLLAGVNDSDADAERLTRLLRGIPCKVNLIPWNPFAGPSFERPSAERIRTFQERLRAAMMAVYIRTPRGDDIDAACGQLAARPSAELIPAARLERAAGQA